ncbi:MAG: hypothetical protein DMG58_30890 [Acidobacteria bacterium]|nr:MAG: hypothetical protein DMG58_30890 [Acidobacteriota bacterium]
MHVRIHAWPQTPRHVARGYGELCRRPAGFVEHGKKPQVPTKAVWPCATALSMPGLTTQLLRNLPAGRHIVIKEGTIA